jgi:propionyl-CoA synthetase
VSIDEETLRSELVAAVRRDIGPVAAFRDVSVVQGLTCPDSPAAPRRREREHNRTQQ